MPDDLPRHASRHRRVPTAVLAAVVLAVAVGAGAVAVTHQAGTSARAPASADPAAPSRQAAPARPAPPRPTGASPTGASPIDPPATEPTTAPPPTTVGQPPPPAPGADVPATLAPGVVATVRTVTPVRAVPPAAGGAAGPGAVVRLAVRNDSGAAVDLSGLTVDATAAGAPAPQSQGGVAAPLAGTLDAGRQTSGTYVFATPASADGPLLLRVGLPGSPAVPLGAA